MTVRVNKRKVDGILLLDKRLGVSSNQALQEVKRLFNARKAGHTGSLDPLATGLLPICFGEATKVSSFLLEDDKTYYVDVQLGIVTDTGDLEGNVLSSASCSHVTLEDINQCLKNFIGEVEQIPPMYSALKHQGRKLYEFARQGKTVERKARLIRIHEIDLMNYDEGVLSLTVRCTKGTYIRTLAEDIGAFLGCGGTVKSLRRLEAGKFSIDNAVTILQLQEMSAEQLDNKLLAVDQPLKFIPHVCLSSDQANDVRQGKQLQIEHNVVGLVRMYSKQSFLGLGEMLLGGKLAPKKLFNLSTSSELD